MFIFIGLQLACCWKQGSGSFRDQTPPDRNIRLYIHNSKSADLQTLHQRTVLLMLNPLRVDNVATRITCSTRPQWTSRHVCRLKTMFLSIHWSVSTLTAVQASAVLRCRCCQFWIWEVFKSHSASSIFHAFVLASLYFDGVESTLWTVNSTQHVTCLV